MAYAARRAGFTAARVVGALLLGLLPLLNGSSLAQVPEKKPAPAPAPAQPLPPIPPANPPIGPAVPAPRVIINGRLAQVGGFFGGRTAVNADGRPNATFVQPEREHLRALSRAKQLIEDRDYVNGVKQLGAILESSEDGVLPAEEGQPVRFLKAEAQRTIATMPAEGRKAYEREFAIAAQQQLDKAIAAGDLAGIERVAGQFFYTKAGQEATQLLGNYHLDHGRPLAAALCFERLREQPAAAEAFEPNLSFKTAACWMWAGLPEKARETLVRLKQRDPGVRLSIGGKQTNLFATDASALAWLKDTVGTQPTARFAEADQWTMFRGNAARNAASVGGRPLLNSRWQIPTSNDPRVRSLIGQIRQAYLDQNLTALPALHPLVVNDGTRDVVLLRTALNLLAVDFATGKRIWEVPIDETIDRTLATGAGTFQQNLQQVAESLDERLWDDAAYGALSSDGALVYAIEDLNTETSNPAPTRVMVMANGLRRDVGARSAAFNRLAAYELKTEGKLKWALGGPPGDEALPEADTFFLGPPLPVAGRLFVLAEVKGQIRLLAIDPTRDAFKNQKLVEWSQPLADLEQNITDALRDNRLRRLAGVGPSYGDGVLICPTAAGAVAAVDVTTRSLLWGYTYKSDVADHQSRLEALQANAFAADGQGSNVDRWIDATATISDGRVLLTPVDSTELHCLNLVDGKPLWKAPREDGLFVGCVHDGKAIVIGRGQVRAIQVADGKPAWSKPAIELPPGSLPSGRGFFNAGSYFLPLSTAEVAILDVATGQLNRSISRHGTIPGNLVCYKGAVISQGVEVVERFEQLDIQQQRVAERLKQNADDPVALVELAEIHLDAGKLDDAVAALRRSWQLDPDPLTRDLLFESLLEGLRGDFFKHRAWSTEAEGLIGRPAQQAAWLRVLAQGLQTAGETLPALDAYLRIAELKSNADTLQRVDPTWTVRQDRWLQARLPELRKAAKPEDQTKIDELVQQRFQQALAAQGDDALRLFIDYFDGHAAADQARLNLARRLGGRDPKHMLEIEVLLRRVERGTSAEATRTAVALLAQMFDRAQRPEHAAMYYRRLADDFADAVCLDGKTGKDLVADLPANSPLRVELEDMAIWPPGLVKIDNLAITGNQPRNQLFDLSGSFAPLSTRTTLELQAPATVLARDGLGKQLWSVALSETRQQRNIYSSYVPQFQRAKLHGNFVVATIGNDVYAIDGISSGGAAKLLWKQNLTETIPGLSSGGNASNDPFQQQILLGGRVFFNNGGYVPPGAALGPVTGGQVCFQRVRNLVALDPLTGETLWIRQNIPPQSLLFGDDEYVLVVPPATPGQPENGPRPALVFRAADGLAVGQRVIPASEFIAPVTQRPTTIGRHVLIHSQDGGRRTVRLYDPVMEKNVWQSRVLAGGAKIHVWRQEAVTIVEPEGHALVLNLRDGRTLVNSPVEPVTDPKGPIPNLLGDVYLLGSRDHFVIVANSFSQSDSKLAAVQPIPFGYTNPVNPRIHGRAYGFDRKTGAKLWSLGIEKQGLMLEQPTELPVLVFAATVADQQANFNTRAQAKVSLLCVDKRNGRELVNKQLAYAIANYELVADVDKKTIDLKMPRDSIRMTFTEQPLPAAPAEGEKPAANKQSSLLMPVLKALLKPASSPTPPAAKD